MSRLLSGFHLTATGRCGTLAYEDTDLDCKSRPLLAGGVATLPNVTALSPAKLNVVKAPCRYGVRKEQAVNFMQGGEAWSSRLAHNQKLRGFKSHPCTHFMNTRIRDREKANESQRRWYYRNREKQIAWVRAGELKVRQWLDEYKKTLSCPCGENHPACLDFHHRDPSQKKQAIGAMRCRTTIGVLKREIEKCDVMCANCHRKKHYVERTALTNNPT